MKPYRSPYEAYPFLCDDSDDLRCDFELLTDELASVTGLLRAQVTDEPLREELLWLCELIYHINPTLRTYLTVTETECTRLSDAVQRLQEETGNHGFVLTQGCAAACTAHFLRVRAKCLVRLLYRYGQLGHEIPPLLLDICNLLSGYYFSMALKLNAMAGTEEVSYTSRNY